VLMRRKLRRRRRSPALSSAPLKPVGQRCSSFAWIETRSRRGAGLGCEGCGFEPWTAGQIFHQMRRFFRHQRRHSFDSQSVPGVSAAHPPHNNVLVAGAAGLVAGAMSMAAGEYVSVHSQADTEQAERELERAEIEADSTGEHKEMAAIHIGRGLDPSPREQVARQQMGQDVSGTHARDEWGVRRYAECVPFRPRLASAGGFAMVAASPLLVTMPTPQARLIPFVAATSLAFLALLDGWLHAPTEPVWWRAQHA